MNSCALLVSVFVEEWSRMSSKSWRLRYGVWRAKEPQGVDFVPINVIITS